jgi:hypothetical protein
MTTKVALRMTGRPASTPGALLAAGPRCGVCDAVIGRVHRHLLAVAGRALVCGCADCHARPDSDRHRADPDRYLAVPDRYLAVPDRYLEFAGDVLDAATWDELRVPAGLAFVSRPAAGAGLVVCGPALGRTTEAELPEPVWERLVERHPSFAVLRPGVEALLLRRAGCFLVPIDACLELAGMLRTSWRGFDGGPAGAGSLASFFARVRARCQPIGSELLIRPRP